MKENSLASIIRSAATAKIAAKYNLAQYKEEKERMELRKKICGELVEIADEHKIPLSFLVYISVDKQSHRPINFEKNFHKFNRDKALAIIGMAKTFGEYHGYKKPSDKVYHALCAYYERCTTSRARFLNTLRHMTVNNKFPTAKAIMVAMGMGDATE